MKKSLIKRVLIIWLLFIPIAILNGTFRQFVLLPNLGDTIARQISTLILSLAYVLTAYLIIKNKIGELDSNKLWVIGLFWLFLTLIFEFSLGILGGKTWEYMLADYKLGAGRIWPLFLLTVLMTPHIVKWLKLNPLTRR
jgi:hypothetical protein